MAKTPNVEAIKQQIAALGVDEATAKTMLKDYMDQFPQAAPTAKAEKPPVKAPKAKKPKNTGFKLRMPTRRVKVAKNTYMNTSKKGMSITKVVNGMRFTTGPNGTRISMSVGPFSFVQEIPLAGPSN